MRRSTLRLAAFTSALLILVFVPSVSVAMEVTISAQDPWKSTFLVENGFVGGGLRNTGAVPVAPSFPPTEVAINVNPGDYLIFSFDPDTSGKWTDGASTSGPGGSPDRWPDNFLNLTDLGVGPYEAKTHCKYWDALVGYIGSSPPARGSYASPLSPNVRSQAERVFPVFPGGLTTSVLQVKEGGKLWLAFNADAYSNYTVDNSSAVKVSVQRSSSGSRPSVPSLEKVCDVADVIPGVPFVFKVVCLVGNQFVSGMPVWAPTSEGEGQLNPQEQQEQVCDSVSPVPASSPVPAPASNMSVSVTSGGAGIGVRWSDKSNNQEGFDIAYSPTQDIVSAKHTFVQSNQTFLASDWGLAYTNDGLLVAGQTMCFQVRAYNASGSSPTPWICKTI